jgi:hypothetical protein
VEIAKGFLLAVAFGLELVALAALGCSFASATPDLSVP